MASNLTQSFAYGFNKIETDKADSEDNSDESVMSESDGLLRTLPARSKSSYSIRKLLKEPLAAFIAGGLMFTTVIMLSLVALAAIQTRGFTLNPGHMRGHDHTTGNSNEHESHHNHDSKAMASVSENGLRLSEDGLLMECGANAEEAKANGCTFDSFAFSYVPPACLEHDLMKEVVDPTSYLAPEAAGVFPWYRDAAWTEPVPQNETEMAQYKFLWTNNVWHKAHCLYMWRISNRAINRVVDGEKPVYVLKHTLETGHTRHCNQLVSDPVTPDETPVWAFRSQGICIRLDEVEKGWKEPELDL